MQGKFDKQIDEWIDAHREAMVEDIKRLVSIPSVSDPTEETKPFGKECRRAMDDACLLYTSAVKRFTTRHQRSIRASVRQRFIA